MGATHGAVGGDPRSGVVPGGYVRNAYASVWQQVYSEYYCNLVAAWVHTLQDDKLFGHFDDRTLRHFDVLDTSKLKDAPDGEAKYVFYGKMR